MKYKNFTQTIKLIGCLVMSTVLFNSCSKDLDLTDDYEEGEVQQNGTAKMRFINASPDIGGVSVKFNGGSVVGDSLFYKNFSGYTDVSVGSSDNGFTMDMIATLDSSNNLPGEQLVEFYTPNNDKEGVVGTFAQTNFLLKKDEKYVCFVVDAMLTDGLGNPFPLSDPIYLVGHVVLTEDLPADSIIDSLSTVRFYNLSSTIGPVDFKITNNTSGEIITVSNNQFLKYPVLQIVHPGNYNFEITQGGPISSNTNVDIQVGKGYTFYLRGINGVTGDKQLELDHFTNGE